MDEASLIALNWRLREIEKTLNTLRKAMDMERETLARHEMELSYLLVECKFIEDAIQYLRSQP